MAPMADAEAPLLAGADNDDQAPPLASVSPVSPTSVAAAARPPAGAAPSSSPVRCPI
jgi:hypothetical protein